MRSLFCLLKHRFRNVFTVTEARYERCERCGKKRVQVLTDNGRPVHLEWERGTMSDSQLYTALYTSTNKTQASAVGASGEGAPKNCTDPTAHGSGGIIDENQSQNTLLQEAQSTRPV